MSPYSPIKLRPVLKFYGGRGRRVPPSSLSVPPSRWSVPPSRFRRPPIEIWALIDERKKTSKVRSNIASNSAGIVIEKKKLAFFCLHLIFGEKHFSFRRRPFFFGLHLISGGKTHQFLDSRRRLLSFLVFIQFRRRNYVIFTKVQSRLQKRPPMQNFTIQVQVTTMRLKTRK